MGTTVCADAAVPPNDKVGTALVTAEVTFCSACTSEVLPKEKSEEGAVVVAALTSEFALALVVAEGVAPNENKDGVV